VDAFHKGGGKGKPLFLKVQLSYAATKQGAEDGAYDQWRTNVLDSHLLTDFQSIQEMEEAAKTVRREDLYSSIRISADLDEHLDWIKQDQSLGFSTIVLHNVNRDQEKFINDFGKKILRKFTFKARNSC